MKATTTKPQSPTTQPPATDPDAIGGDGRPVNPVIRWHCQTCQFDWSARSSIRQCPKCKSKKISGDPRPVHPSVNSTSTPNGIAANDPDDQRHEDQTRDEALAAEDLSGVSTVELGRRHMTGTGLEDQKAARERLAKKPGASNGQAIDPPHRDTLNAPIADIRPSPDNPRKTFDPKSIDELAASIEANGLLQRLTVRVVDARRGGHALYELIAGERRLRAVKQLGWKLVPVEIVCVTDQEAAALRLVENLERQDLNPIELAQAYEAMLTKQGFTQQQLADQLGIAQSSIAGKLRLLKLPEGLRKRIITAEIPERRAREWLKFADLPGVLEQVAAAWKKELPEFEEDDTRELSNLADEVSRPMHQNTWSVQHRRFKTTPALEKELDIREIPSPYGGRPEKRAFNVKRWDELNAAAESRAEKREAVSKAAAERKQTPAEAKAKAKKLAEQFDKRLYRWKIVWLQTLCARELLKPAVDQAIVLKLLLHFTNATRERMDRGKDLGKAIRDAGGHPGTDGYGGVRGILKGLGGIAEGKLWQVARQSLAAWIQFSTEVEWHAHIQAREIESLAGELGIDLKKEWKVTQEFLELHTKDQVAALIEEWGDLAPRTLTRKETIAYALQHCAAGKIPKEVLEVKGK